MRSKSLPLGPSAGPPPAPARPSFAEIYEKNVDHVWWRLRHFGVPASECDDATQEVFLVVHRRLAEYQPRDRLSGWLGAIGRNVAAKFREREGRRRETPFVGPEASEGAFDLAGEMASAAEVFQVLQDVEPELRFVFIQHFLDEVPVPEIARHLGIPLGTAKTRVRFSRSAVKAAWTRYKARERHAMGRSNVVPILGPLPWFEAGRQVPPLSAEVRARIWSGIQAGLAGSGGGGGGEGGGGGDPPASRPAVGALGSGVFRAVAAIVIAASFFGAGVIVGIRWAPRTASRSPVGPVAASEPEAGARPAEVPAPTDANAAPSAAPSASALPVASGDAAVDVESALMDKASGALATGQIEVALAAVREHASRFHGGGRRAGQREALWITALVRAGRTLEARERLARFEAASPNSPRLGELREAVGSP